MVIKRSPGGESRSAGGGRSASKSTCVVPVWALTSENASFRVSASRWSHQLTFWPQEMFTFLDMLAMVVSESSFGAFVCHKALGQKSGTKIKVVFQDSVAQRHKTDYQTWMPYIFFVYGPNIVVLGAMVQTSKTDHFFKIGAISVSVDGSHWFWYRWKALDFSYP